MEPKRIRAVPPPGPDADVAAVLDEAASMNAVGAVAALVLVALCRDGTVYRDFAHADDVAPDRIVGALEMLKDYYLRHGLDETAAGQA